MKEVKVKITIITANNSDPNEGSDTEIQEKCAYSKSPLSSKATLTCKNVLG
jgi:hypothetical protein